HYFEIDKVTSSVNKAADSLLQSVTLRENSVINTRHPQHWKEEKSIEKNEQEEEEEEEETVNEVAAESISSFLAGWGAERPVVEAMIRLWPLAYRDVNWETLLNVWTGSAACLTPARPHAAHARASRFSLGDDLPPLIL
ncbi:hypothetical protein OTU49_010572, partial [Cherax quadricarinatus]